jgi:hypothetical protein
MSEKRIQFEQEQCGKGVQPVCMEHFNLILNMENEHYQETHTALAVLQSDLRGFIALYENKQAALVQGQQELKELLVGQRGIYDRIKLLEQTAAQQIEDVKNATDERLRKLESRQIWFMGFAAGAGAVLAKIWEYFTSKQQ